MSNAIVLSNPDKSLQATILPHSGMTLRSLLFGETEIITQKRAAEYAACRKGFGPLIGPHFSQRKQIPATALAANETLWPQAAALREAGIKDIWQHGTARYVPWNYEATTNTVRARLTGNDCFAGQPLREIEGGDFELNLTMTLEDSSLSIHYTSQASFPTLIGLHYYYALPGGQGLVQAPVKSKMMYQQKNIPVPAAWLKDSRLRLTLDQELDHVFTPAEGSIELTTRAYRLSTIPETGVKSFIVFHPQNEEWACVEPLSASDITAPIETEAEIKLRLKLEKI